MRMRGAAWILAAAVVLLGCRAAPAVEMEDGPAYLTDSHGAQGVAMAMLELAKDAPEYARYGKGALDWLIHVAERDDAGRLAWMMSTSAPKGHPSHRISVPGQCGIIRTFLDGYKASGDERYKAAALAGTRTLVERFARQKETPLGTAWAWSHAYRPNDRSEGLLAGHSHGLGNILDSLLAAYEAGRDERLKEPMRGLLVNLRVRGKETTKDGRTLIAWPTLKNPKIVETGYCYGQAGLVLPLLRMAERAPEVRLSDGTTALSLANANLRYLMSIARAKGDGTVWPYMRHDDVTRNPGLGSGTGGIGWAMLRGAEVNRKTDPAFADACLTYARGAAVYATDLVLSAQAKGPLRSPGGDAGFGVCGGAGGTGYLLMLYAEELGDRDPALTRRMKKAIAKVARTVIASAETLDDGTMVIPDRQRFKRINLALDYGQTGVLLGLAMTGRYLEDDAIRAAARKVADYIAKQAVPEGGGLKFAQFQPLPEEGAPGEPGG